MLTATPDATKKTLTITSTAAMQPMDIKNIYFGNSTKDTVLCLNAVTSSDANAAPDLNP